MSNGKESFSILDTKAIQLFYSIEYFGRVIEIGIFSGCKYLFKVRISGYAVTSGRYFKSSYQKRWTAVGAPRGSSLRGLVFVFEFPDPNESVLLPYGTLEGDRFGAYFGSVLTSGDFNADGLDDLLVGAPFRGRGGFFPDAGDEGCVFAYSAKRV